MKSWMKPYGDPHDLNTDIFNSLLDSVPEGGTLCLPRRTYIFSKETLQQFSCSLSNSDESEGLFAGLLLQERKNLTIDGNGSLLLCHGQMLPLGLLDCEDLTLRNFTADWDIPLTAEGLITAAEDDYIDILIDEKQFPFHIEDGALYFDCGDSPEKLHFWGHTEFDPRRNRLAPHRGDHFPPTRQELLPNGQVRFRGNFAGIRPTPGNILVLRHGQRIHPGILIHHCRRITLEHITLYGSGGLGILGQFSDTLVFSHVDLIPNRAAGRYFAGLHDDGIHLSANSGLITIENCRFLGLMDDPVNVHGIAVNLNMQPKGDSFCGKFMHPQSKGHALWAESGQEVVLLNGDTMEELARARVLAFHLLDREHFEIQLDTPLNLLKSQSCSSFSLENISRTPGVICRHNYFGACRARGLLVTTPRPVLIEDNIFESAGAAIRIAGDVCTWYESGRCRNVVIQHNTFCDSCLQNDYQGGQGMISISPELPSPDSRFPCHRNLCIRKNNFCISDARILYALCTEGLHFTDNIIRKSGDFPYAQGDSPHFTLEHCKDSLIENNTFLGF